MDVADRVRNETFAQRLTDLWERTGDEGLYRILEGQGLTDVADAPPLADREPQEHLDWVSTALMQCFQRTGDPQVFAALHELNEGSFAQAIHGRLRRSASRVDERDVLQEVFLNIYRYPHRFVAEKADSFRNWGHRIAQNTLLKFLKLESRRQRTTPLAEDLAERVDTRAPNPLRAAAYAEQHRAIDRAFLIYLNLYLIHFRQLSAKEQRALTLVEVEGTSYREAAADLGIRLENLKMVVFRARRKVFRGMSRTMAEFQARGGQRSDIVRACDSRQANSRAGSNPPTGAVSRSILDSGSSTPRGRATATGSASTHPAPSTFDSP